MLTSAEQEERDFVYATDGDWDREEARELGQLHPEKCWILTDRDAWHRNPNFVGPTEPHPEDEDCRHDGPTAWDADDDCDCPETPACHQELCEDCREAFEGDQLNSN